MLARLDGVPRASSRRRSRARAGRCTGRATPPRPTRSCSASPARTASREVVKVKSLTTDEIGLNDALAAGGVDAIETDLAELILQLAGDWSSHILVPAIHRNRTEIRDLFGRTIAAGAGSRDDPGELAEAARLYLREKFLTRTRRDSAAPTSRVAETGTLCVVESEGNGRMCTTLPPVLGHDPRDREARAASSPTSRCSCSCCRARRPASG